MLDQLGSLEDDAARLTWTIGAIAVVLILRWLVTRAIVRRLDTSELIFRVRKTSVYISAALLLAIIAGIWIGEARNFATVVGVLGAGLVIALTDVVMNFAGWIYIMLRSPFTVGDRIEVGEHAGDVIDIRVLRFSLLEIRNWVGADQTTGRILHIPNGRLFRESMANFTQGFEQIWHEIEVVVTFESDWERARDIVQAALEAHAAHVGEEEATRSLERASRQYFIKYGHLTPTVYVSVRDYGVLLSGRVLVNPRSRRTIDHELWTQILLAFGAEDEVQLAYPTARWVLGGAESNPHQASHQERE